MDIRTIPKDANSFTGISGKEYIIRDSISAGRFPHFEAIQIEMAHGVSVTGFQSEVQRVYSLLNQMKFADGCTALYNALNGAERIANAVPHPVMRLCTLFMCEPDEALEKWDEASALKKVEDWADIELDFFLRSANYIVRHYMGVSNSGSRTSLSETATNEGESEMYKL